MSFKKNKKSLNHGTRKLNIISKDSPFAYIEAYKSLRTNLNFVSIDNRYKKILVTSSVPAEGKSNVVINLAVSLSQGGSKVLVMDCDLRRPIMHKYLTINKPGCGLTSVLSGDIFINEAITYIDEAEIAVLCAGPIPPNPAELLESEKMGMLIAELEKEYDYIIFDTPPASMVTDPAVLSRYVDGVLMVVRQNYAPIEAAKMAVKNLRAVDANIIGAIFNDFSTKKIGKENGYSYTYGYEYY